MECVSEPSGKITFPTYTHICIWRCIYSRKHRVRECSHVIQIHSRLLAANHPIWDTSHTACVLLSEGIDYGTRNIHHQRQYVFILHRCTLTQSTTFTMYAKKLYECQAYLVWLFQTRRQLMKLSLRYHQTIRTDCKNFEFWMVPVYALFSLFSIENSFSNAFVSP